MDDRDLVLAFHACVAPYVASDPTAHAFWTGPRVSGYGMLKGQWAHRLAWEIHNGQIGDGLVVRHLCNTRSCVRVDGHLEVGTQTDNMDDRAAAGRTSVLGPLSDTEIIAVRWLYATERFSQNHISSLLWGDGSGQSRIARIVNGTSHGHLGGPITRRGQGNRPSKGPK